MVPDAGEAWILVTENAGCCLTVRALAPGSCILPQSDKAGPNSVESEVYCLEAVETVQLTAVVRICQERWRSFGYVAAYRIAKRILWLWSTGGLKNAKDGSPVKVALWLEVTPRPNLEIALSKSEMAEQRLLAGLPYWPG